MDKPVFILGAHKSGTSLLRNLLDGHPELFVIPCATHIFEFAHYWVDYRLRTIRPPQQSFNEIKAASIDMIERYNLVSNSVSDANLVGRFNLQILKDSLDCEISSMKDFIINFIHAIYTSLYESKLPDHVRFVEKSVEHVEFTEDIKRMFPGAKFIHIIRNPYANLVSLRRQKKFTGQRRKGYPFIGKALLALNSSYYHLYRNKRLISDYLVIRYEDLLSDSVSTMRMIADFMEIDFLEILLQPTSLGEAWLGNSSRNLNFSGISRTNLDLWEKEISSLEAYLITKYFLFLLNDYNYPVFPQRKSWLMPAPREWPHVYFLNRAIPFFM